MTNKELIKANKILKAENKKLLNERESLLDEIVPKRKRLAELEKTLAEVKKKEKEKLKLAEKEIENYKAKFKKEMRTTDELGKVIYDNNVAYREELDKQAERNNEMVYHANKKANKYRERAETYENALRIIAGGAK